MLVSVMMIGSVGLSECRLFAKLAHISATGCFLAASYSRSTIAYRVEHSKECRYRDAYLCTKRLEQLSPADVSIISKRTMRCKPKRKLWWNPSSTTDITSEVDRTKLQLSFSCILRGFGLRTLSGECKMFCTHLLVTMMSSM